MILTLYENYLLYVMRNSEGVKRCLSFFAHAYAVSCMVRIPNTLNGGNRISNMKSIS